MGHVMNGSCYEWIMLQMDHVMNESCYDTVSESLSFNTLMTGVTECITYKEQLGNQCSLLLNC